MGVNVSRPAARSATVRLRPAAAWAAVIATPSRARVPAAGSEVMITAFRPLAGVSAGSENWKSEAAKTLAVSSASVTDEAAATGASLIGVMVRLTLTGADCFRPSEAA